MAAKTRRGEQGTKAKGAGRPRPASRDLDQGDAGPSTSGNSPNAGAAAGRGGSGGPSVGQQTSKIRNKLKRSELYQELKHKQEVLGTVHAAGGQAGGRGAGGAGGSVEPPLAPPVRPLWALSSFCFGAAEYDQLHACSCSVQAWGQRVGD
jgi:hypothetical protein